MVAAESTEGSLLLIERVDSTPSDVADAARHHRVLVVAARYLASGEQAPPDLF